MSLAVNWRGSSEQGSGGWGSFRVSHKPQSWAGYREVGNRVERGGGVGCRDVTPHPISWEHREGVKEARELSANLGVKWEVLCHGKRC